VSGSSGERGSVKAGGDLSGQRLVRLLGQETGEPRKVASFPGLFLMVVDWSVKCAWQTSS
jgi:hypothetical protein